MTMKPCKKLAALLLAHLIICMSALYLSADEAERKWTSYGKDLQEIEYFFDKDAIARPAANIIQVWRKRVFPQRSAQREIVALDEINCRLQKFRALELHVTAWDGSTKISNKLGPWATIWSKSAEEHFLDTVCKEPAAKASQEQEKTSPKD
jgi:hypothetical protein